MTKLIFYVLMSSSSSCDFQHWTLLFFLSRVIHFFICCCWCSLLVASWLPHIRRWQAKEKVLCTFECVCLCVLGIFFLIGFPHPSTPPTQPGAGNSEDLSLRNLLQSDFCFVFFFQFSTGVKYFFKLIPTYAKIIVFFFLFPAVWYQFGPFLVSSFPLTQLLLLQGTATTTSCTTTAAASVCIQQME